MSDNNKEAWLTTRNHGRNPASVSSPFLLRSLGLLGLMFLSLPVWSSEATLRVAFVYNFIKFIHWPTSDLVTADPSFHLCVLGAKGETRTALAQLNGKTVPQQVVLVIYLDDSASVAAKLPSCQLLYQPEQGLPLVLPRPLPAGVVLVVDEPVPGTPDVALSLMRNGDGPLEFRVDLEVTARAGVTVSSQLLKLAKSTRGNGG